MSAEKKSGANSADLLKDFCLTETYSDVTLVVGVEQIPAHRIILAAQSPYLHDFCLVGFCAADSRTYKFLPGPQRVEEFKLVLRLAYGDNQILDQLSSAQIFDVSYEANRYQFKGVLKTCLEHLSKQMTLDNVVSILNLSVENKLTDIIENCYNFLDENALEFVTNANFMKLSEASLVGLLQRDTFSIDEIKIFTAVSKWYEQNPTANKEKIIKKIRFSLMDNSDLLRLASMPLAPERTQFMEAMKKNTFQLKPRKRNSENQPKNRFFSCCLN